MFTIYELFYLVGFYGFYMVALIFAFHLVPLGLDAGTRWFAWFFFGAMLNDALNAALKEWIRDPRPTRCHEMQLRGAVDSVVGCRGSGHYGFPSGHAQLVFYALGFFYAWARYQMTYGGLLAGFVAGLTLYQRWKFRRHTVEQLVAGSVVGLAFGMGFVWLGGRGR